MVIDRLSIKRDQRHDSSHTARWQHTIPVDQMPQCTGPVGLGLQGLYSATNCADNILGCFTIIFQNRIARVDQFTNLTKRRVFMFRLNASISSHNLICFCKQFHTRGPYTANAHLPKVSCLTHWGQHKMAANFLTTFSKAFLKSKCMNFD